VEIVVYDHPVGPVGRDEVVRHLHAGETTRWLPIMVGAQASQVTEWPRVRENDIAVGRNKRLIVAIVAERNDPVHNVPEGVKNGVAYGRALHVLEIEANRDSVD
jgi:hypothetical protein